MIHPGQLCPSGSRGGGSLVTSRPEGLKNRCQLWKWAWEGIRGESEQGTPVTSLPSPSAIGWGGGLRAPRKPQPQHRCHLGCAWRVCGANWRPPWALLCLQEGDTPDQQHLCHCPCHPDGRQQSGPGIRAHHLFPSAAGSLCRYRKSSWQLDTAWFGSTHWWDCCLRQACLASTVTKAGGWASQGSLPL